MLQRSLTCCPRGRLIRLPQTVNLRVATVLGPVWLRDRHRGNRRCGRPRQQRRDQDRLRHQIADRISAAATVMDGVFGQAGGASW